MTGNVSHPAAVARIVAAVAIALVAMALAPPPPAEANSPRGVICDDGSYVRSASQCSEPEVTTVPNPADTGVPDDGIPDTIPGIVCADGTKALLGQCNLDTDLACADGSYVAPGGTCPKGDTRVYEWCADSNEYLPPGQSCKPLPTPTSLYKSCPWNDGDPDTDDDEIIVFADERCPPRPRAADFEPDFGRAVNCVEPPQSAAVPDTPKLVGTGENGRITDRDRAAYDALFRPGSSYNRAWDAAIRAHEAAWRAYDRCRGLSFDS